MKQDIIDIVSTTYPQIFNWVVKSENMDKRRERSFMRDKAAQARNVLKCLDEHYISINRLELDQCVDNLSDAYENGDNDMVEVYIEKLKDLIKEYK